MFTPVATFASLGWVIGVAMIAEGIGSILTWNTRRQLGFADGWTLAGAIVSVVLGIFVVGSLAFQVAIDHFIIYLVAAWLIFAGIMRIVVSFKLREIHKTGVEVGKYWYLLLIAGILIIIMGIVCIIYPMIAAISIGILVGLSIAFSGGSLIANVLGRQ